MASCLGLGRAQIGALRPFKRFLCRLSHCRDLAFVALHEGGFLFAEIARRGVIALAEDFLFLACSRSGLAGCCLGRLARGFRCAAPGDGFDLARASLGFLGATFLLGGFRACRCFLASHDALLRLNLGPSRWPQRASGTNVPPRDPSPRAKDTALPMMAPERRETCTRLSPVSALSSLPWSLPRRCRPRMP